MKELLDEINKFLEERTKKATNKQTTQKSYKPRVQTLEKIGVSNGETFDYSIHKLVFDFFEGDQEAVLLFFRSFTHIPSKKIESMTEDTKWTIYTKIKEELAKISISSRFFSTFFKYRIHPLKDRVKLVVEDPHIKLLTFITKEEEEDVFNHFREITLLLMKDILGLPIEKKEKTLLSHFLEIGSNPYTNTFSVLSLLTDQYLTRTFGEEHLFSLKKQAHDWYQQLSKKPLTTIGPLQQNYVYFSHRFFLLNDTEKKYMQEKYLKHYKRRFKEAKQQKSTKSTIISIRNAVKDIVDWI